VRGLTMVGWVLGTIKQQPVNTDRTLPCDLQRACSVLKSSSRAPVCTGCHPLWSTPLVRKTLNDPCRRTTDAADASQTPAQTCPVVIVTISRHGVHLHNNQLGKDNNSMRPLLMQWHTNPKQVPYIVV